MRKAYSIAVASNCKHGMNITSIFTLANSRNEALAVGINTILSEEYHANCGIQIMGSHVNEVNKDVIVEAFSELNSEGKE